MNTESYVVLLLIGLWIFGALWYMKKSGGCCRSQGSCGDCKKCGKCQSEKEAYRHGKEDRNV